MKTLHTLSLVAASLLSTGAPAQDEGGLRRDQVKAELAAARASGSLNLGGETGLRARDLHPGLYPAAADAAATPTTRAAVQAAYDEARRIGDLVLGESSLSEYAQSPQHFPARPLIAGLSREQVRADLAEALRLGDIVIGEQGRTLAETFPQQYAAVRAEHAAAMRARAATLAAQQLAQAHR